MKKIFIIDSSIPSLKMLKKILENQNYLVNEFSDILNALSRIYFECPDLIIMDISSPQNNSINVINQIKSFNNNINIIITTSYIDFDRINFYLKNGATDYILKPFSLDKIKNTLNSIFQNSPISLNTPSKNTFRFIGESKSIKNCIANATKAASNNSPVLITGDYGIGKKHFAYYIHYNSSRKYNNSVEINCSNIPKYLSKNIFCGHEKGSIKTSSDSSYGKLELANKGTLILNEINDLSLELQEFLLNVLNSNKYQRIGSKENIYLDFRLICTSTKNLLEETNQGKFREDLFNKISTVSINIPSLRERTDDIDIFIKYFINQYNKKNKSSKEISSEALKVLKNYEWIGNIKELKNTIHSSLCKTPDKIIDLQSLPEYIIKYSNKSKNKVSTFNSKKTISLEQLQNKYIIKTLKQFNGNKKEASKALGICEKTLYNKLSKI